MKEIILFDGKPMLKVYIIPLIFWGILALLSVIGIPFYIIWITGITKKSYYITNSRIREFGRLKKGWTILDLRIVKNIEFHQGVIEKMFNSGTITCYFQGHDIPPVLRKVTYRALPNSKELFERLKEATLQKQ